MSANFITTEAMFQSLLLKGARKCSKIALAFVGHSRMQKGIPDTYHEHRIWTGWWELKTDNHHLSTEQKFFLKHMQSAYCIRLIREEGSIIVEDHNEKPITATSFIACPTIKAPTAWVKPYLNLLAICRDFEAQKDE